MQDIAALQEELTYYKKLADKNAGDTINSQYIVAQLSNECKQLLNVFHIIADLHRSFNYLMQPAEFHEIVLESLLSRMSLTQVMLLKIKEEHTLIPFHSKGFGKIETAGECSFSL